jgi:hypothetical protein
VRRNKWQGRTVLLLSTITLVAIIGCPPQRETLAPVTDDVPARIVIERVNDNARGMDFMVRAGGVSASGKLVGASGKRESFDASGTLYFRRPRDLYMELKHSLAGKLEMGSNHQEFWYWERFDERRYYTGRHDLMAKPWESDVPLRPDQFLDMLGLNELPTGSDGVSGATFSVAAEYYNLNFFDRDPAGNTFQSKSVAISRRAPFLISAITYYNPEGRAWMRAELKNYRPIDGTSVMTPRRIEINSLEDQSWITLEFGNMRPSENKRLEQERILQSPEQRERNVGEIIRMDRAF